MTERRLAFATVIATFLLLIVGGIVHGTGSSLACPDWPTCYGTFFPEMKGGVFFEHSHRLVASLVGLLTVILAVLIFRNREDPATRRMALLAVGLVIFQGVLGGVTVLFKLPTAVSSTHLAVSMIFFSWMIVLAFRLHAAPTGPLDEDLQKDVRPRVALVGGLVYLQIVLGGVVRHTHAGLACPDIPLCRSSLWWAGLPALSRLHMAHRFLAVAVAVAVFWVCVYLLRRIEEGRPIRMLATLAPVVMMGQILLGFLSVTTLLQWPVVAAHLAGGALLLATFVSLWLFCGPAPQESP